MNTDNKELSKLLDERVVTWAGGRYQAEAWYRSQPIPQFGGLTAEDVVKLGRPDIVIAYIKQVMLCGHA